MAKVVINEQVCKSCLYCINFCPKNVLAKGSKTNRKGYEYITVANPDDCIGCGICARMCPDAAIDVYK